VQVGRPMTWCWPKHVSFTTALLCSELQTFMLRGGCHVMLLTAAESASTEKQASRPPDKSGDPFAVVPQCRNARRIARADWLGGMDRLIDLCCFLAAQDENGNTPEWSKHHAVDNEHIWGKEGWCEAVEPKHKCAKLRVNLNGLLGCYMRMYGVIARGARTTTLTGM